MAALKYLKMEAFVWTWRSARESGRAGAAAGRWDLVPRECSGIEPESHRPGGRVKARPLLKSGRMSGVLARILYALLLAGILGVAAWISFSRFVLGKAEEVPDLTGRSVDEATALRGRAGPARRRRPVAGGLRRRRSPSTAIRGQSPAAGMAVKAGQDLRVFLSLGPEIVRTPDLAGLTARTAALALAREGLAEGAVSAVRLPGPHGRRRPGNRPGGLDRPRYRRSTFS